MTHPLQQALDRLRSVDRSALPPHTSRLISMAITDLRLFICVGGEPSSEYVNAAAIVASPLGVPVAAVAQQENTK